MMDYKAMVIMDLDGTILPRKGKIDERDLEVIDMLEKMKVCRVIATGRSVFSFKRALGNDFPIDYLIFSSGAGVLNWKTKELIYSRNLQSDETQMIVKKLWFEKLSFALHEPIPDNHKYLYADIDNTTPDFYYRNELYSQYAKPLENPEAEFGEACQFLIISKNNSGVHEKVKKMFPGYHVERTTSPLDGKSIWTEIFPRGISKGSGSWFLANILDIPLSDIMALGNDYNDVTLLDWTENSFIVSNSPDELCEKYEVVGDDENTGLCEAIYRFNEKMNIW
jgi:HAD superfamily hydrolase (TIGR01484 family)